MEKKKLSIIGIVFSIITLLAALITIETKTITIFPNWGQKQPRPIHKGLEKFIFLRDNTNYISYFSSNCPDLHSQYLNLHIKFNKSSTIKDIEYLYVVIERLENKDNKEQRTFVTHNFYEAKYQNNLIRIPNTFEKGIYQIRYGFIFTKDLKSLYRKDPTFYYKNCIVIKQ